MSITIESVRSVVFHPVIGPFSTPSRIVAVASFTGRDGDGNEVFATGVFGVSTPEERDAIEARLAKELPGSVVDIPDGDSA